MVIFFKMEFIRRWDVVPSVVLCHQNFWWNRLNTIRLDVAMRSVSLESTLMLSLMLSSQPILSGLSFSWGGELFLFTSRSCAVSIHIQTLGTMFWPELSIWHSFKSWVLNQPLSTFPLCILVLAKTPKLVQIQVGFGWTWGSESSGWSSKKCYLA